jgi:hypothetical protein
MTGTPRRRVGNIKSVCRINCCWFSPAQSILFPGPVRTHDHIFVLSKAFTCSEMVCLFDKRRGLTSSSPSGQNIKFYYTCFISHWFEHHRKLSTTVDPSHLCTVVVNCKRLRKDWISKYFSLSESTFSSQSPHKLYGTKEIVDDISIVFLILT